MIRRTEAAAWCAVFVLCGVVWWVTQTPTPYKHVDVRSITRTEGEIELVATFKKTACEFRRLNVVGGLAGQTQFIQWRDLDDPQPDEDRTVGEQTLRISFGAEGFDWVEIRTRHDCDGEKVDKVFHRIEPVPEIETTD